MRDKRTVAVAARWLLLAGLAASAWACGQDAAAPDQSNDADATVDASDVAATDTTVADTPDVAAADAPDAAPDAAPDVAVDVAPDVSACVCGNGKCDSACGETVATCSVDCAGCGDGICEPGEGPKTCAVDCCGACGDGICKGYDCGENPTSCPLDCGSACGNGKCDKGESPQTCAEDCKKQACGNGVCEPEDGGPVACPVDCGTACGNCTCDKGENFVNCPVDCGFCGDGVCSPCATLGETKDTCVQDCKADACKGFDVSKCDDGISCTKDLCGSNGACLNLITPGACVDGSACTDDACDLGLGCTHAKVSCDDGEPCTVDSCDPATGCAHTATGAPCDDGDPCTTDEVCTAKGCLASTAKGCDDGQVCTIDKCQGTLCVHLPATATCEDGNVCSINDFCKAGACEPGGPLNCDDGDDCTVDFCQAGCKHAANLGKCDDSNVCTNDFCDSLTGCIHLANTATCTDGEACTVGDACADSACQPGPVKPCDDGIACTKDYCDGGVCKFTAGSAGCDDANPCTDDACSANSGCVHTANANTCDDGDGCTVKDFCKDSVCQPGATRDCSDGTTCTNDDCVSGACVHTAVGGTCDDGNACTLSDTCQTGTCVGGAAINCDDGNSCTAESCDPANGCATSLVANGAACPVGVCEFGVCAVQCPAGTLKIDLDDGGVSKTVCAFTYPIWGQRPLSPANYTDKGDGTIYDAQTSLIWQQTAPTGTSGWDAAMADCDALVLGGKTDWRLPTLAELESLVDYGKAGPALNSTLFGSAVVTDWSAERMPAPWNSYAWQIDFSSGAFGNFDAANSNHHRCVRGGRSSDSALSQRFRDNGNGSVTDLATALTWQRTLRSGSRNKVNGEALCQGLVLGGGNWRSPTIRELVSLHDTGTTNAWMDASAFPDTPAVTYWTSTFTPASTSVGWYVDNSSSAGSGTTGVSAQYGTRCVRDTGACVTAGDCDDFNPCTTESCGAGGVCGHAPVADNTICGGTGACQAGWCACPADTTAVADDSDVVCAFDYPVWGNRPLTPNTLIDNGNSTVSDSMTGLTWEKSPDSSIYTWNGARDYCNALNLNNKTDWRMPTVAELETLVDYNVNYWSGSTVAGLNSTPVWTALAAPGGKHWTTEFYWGASAVTSGWQGLRCVRGQPATQPYAQRFTDKGDGTVLDKGTGLVWQQDANSPPSPLAGSVTYCTGLALAGGGWRLPNIREAASLLYRVDPASTILMDLTVFPTATAGWTWSSTPRHGSTTDAWQINTGITVPGTYFDTATDAVTVRCVR